MPWLLLSVPDSSSKKQRNPLSLLSRWKIFDNLRRSLVAPVTFLLLILSWTVLEDPLFWTAFIASLYLIPPIIITGWKGIRKPAEQTWMLHLYDMPGVIRGQLAVPLLTLAFLPYEAYISLDAILRSCWRMVVSHRNLLEWTTHQEAGRTGNPSLTETYLIMLPAPVIGAALLLGMALNRPASPAIALFALAWTLSPAIAWGISQPISTRTTSLTPGRNVFYGESHGEPGVSLRPLSLLKITIFPRTTTRSSRFVAVAHRTSPTDIGLSLLANLTAYDFGYIPMGELIGRTQKTLTTIGQLKRFRGHFYNWYDTITLDPLLPRYISTVDSGNLVGNLLVLRQGLYELPSYQVLSKRFADGLSDTLSLLSDAIDAATEREYGDGAGICPVKDCRA